MGFSEDPSIYQLESLPQVHMTEKDIVKASKAAFRTLQMPDQTFEITNTDINSLIGSSLTVTANNGTELIFDAVSGSDQAFEAYERRLLMLSLCLFPSYAPAAGTQADK